MEGNNDNLSAKINPEERVPPREDGSKSDLSEGRGSISTTDSEKKKAKKKEGRGPPEGDDEGRSSGRKTTRGGNLAAIITDRKDTKLPDWKYAFSCMRRPPMLRHAIGSWDNASRVYAMNRYLKTVLIEDTSYGQVFVGNAIGLLFESFHRTAAGTTAVGRPSFGLGESATAPGVALNASSMFATARSLLMGEKPSEVGSALRMNLAQLVGDISLIARSTTCGIIEGSNSAACDKILIKLFMYAVMQCTFTEKPDPLVPGALMRLHLPQDYALGNYYWPMGAGIEAINWVPGSVQARVVSVGDFFRAFGTSVATELNWDVGLIGAPNIHGIAVVPIRSDWVSSNGALGLWTLLFMEYPFRMVFPNITQVTAAEDDDQQISGSRPTNFVRLADPYTKVLYVVVDEWKTLPTGFEVLVGGIAGPVQPINATWILGGAPVAADNVGTGLSSAFSQQNIHLWSQVLAWWKIMYNSKEAWETANLVMTDFMCLRKCPNWRFGGTARGLPYWWDGIAVPTDPFLNIANYYQDVDAIGVVLCADFYMSAFGQKPRLRAYADPQRFNIIHAHIRPFSHVYSVAVAARMVSYANRVSDDRGIITLSAAWMSMNEAAAVGVDLMCERLGFPMTFLRQRGPATASPGIQEKYIRVFKQNVVRQMRENFPLGFYSPRYQTEFEDATWNAAFGVADVPLMIIPYAMVPGQVISKYTSTRRYGKDDSATFKGMDWVSYQVDLEWYDGLKETGRLIKDKEKTEEVITATCVGDWILSPLQNISNYRISDLRGGDRHDLVIPYTSPTSTRFDVIYTHYFEPKWKPKVMPVMMPRLINRIDLRGKMNPRMYLMKGIRSLLFGKNRIYTIQTTVTYSNLSFTPSTASDSITVEEVDKMADEFLN
jgi:hypothetical protein